MSVDSPVRLVEPPESSTRQRARLPDRGVLIFAATWFLVVLFAVLWLDRLGEGRTFFFDEWNFVVGRWRLEPDTFLAAHNGHLSIMPASVFYAMFETVGLDNYRAFRLLAVLVHVSVATAVMIYVRRRLGAFAGLGAGIAILLLGTGWQNILWPFQIGFMGSVLGFVVALLLLERRSLRADVGASACVAIALGCSGVGVAAAGAVLVEIALTRPWRRWWIALGPLFVYGMWYLAYGESQAEAANVDAIPDYVSTSGSAAIAGLYDLSLDWGRFAFGVLLGLLVAQVLHRRGMPARVLALLAMLAAFWALTALSRGQVGEPGASRYVYVGAVVIVLLIAECVPARAARTVAVAGLVLGVGSAWATADIMRAGAGGLRLEGEIIGAELAVVESVRDQTPAAYPIDPVHAPGLLAGEYLEAVDGVGSSPALPVSAIISLSEQARVGADRVLFELAPPAVSLDESQSGRCAPADFVSFDSEKTIESGTRAVIQGTDPATIVSVGRWAPPSFPVEIGDQVTIISFADDGVFGEPWTITTESPGARICVLG
jgi:hypothetical protein